MNILRVLLFCKYDSIGASSRIRCLQYLPELEKQNFKIKVDVLFSNSLLKDIYSGKSYRKFDLIRSVLRRIYSANKAASYDVVWVQKEFLPSVPFWIERLILRKAKRLILDIDDAEFEKYQTGIRKLYLKHKFKKMARYYDLVIVGNDYLGERFKQWGGEIECLPSSVDMDKYKYDTNKYINQSAKRSGSFVIGWIGSRFTQHYVESVLKAVEEFEDGLDQNVTLLLIGASPAIHRHSRLIKVEDWSAESEVEAISRIDVGIMPLPNSTWVEGKCSFKAIQFMALGKPVIVSPTRANITLVDHGVNGYVASNHDEWLERLIEVEKRLRVKNSFLETNRSKIEQEYSIQANTKKLANMLSHK